MAKTASLTQRQLDLAYEGPEVELSERYGAMLNAVFVVLMYSPGLPLIYCFGVVFFASAYWADKITLLEIFKKPQTMDSTLVRESADKFQWAVYLHLAFAAWMFGGLHGINTYVPIITEIANSGLRDRTPGEEMGFKVFLTLVTDRLRRLPALVPFATFVGIMGRDILKAFLQPAWRFSKEWYARRKRRIERKRYIEMRRKAGYDSEDTEDEDEEEQAGSYQTSTMFTYSEALEYGELRGIESYDVLKNPRYAAAYSDREYIPADDSESDNLSEGSFGNDIDDDDGKSVATSDKSSNSRARTPDPS